MRLTHTFTETAIGRGGKKERERLCFATVHPPPPPFPSPRQCLAMCTTCSANEIRKPVVMDKKDIISSSCRLFCDLSKLNTLVLAVMSISASHPTPNPAQPSLLPLCSLHTLTYPPLVRSLRTSPTFLPPTRSLSTHPAFILPPNSLSLNSSSPLSLNLPHLPP